MCTHCECNAFQPANPIELAGRPHQIRGNEKGCPLQSSTSSNMGNELKIKRRRHVARTVAVLLPLTDSGNNTRTLVARAKSAPLLKQLKQEFYNLRMTDHSAS